MNEVTTRLPRVIVVVGKPVYGVTLQVDGLPLFLSDVTFQFDFTLPILTEWVRNDMRRTLIVQVKGTADEWQDTFLKHQDANEKESWEIEEVRGETHFIFYHDSNTTHILNAKTLPQSARN